MIGNEDMGFLGISFIPAAHRHYYLYSFTYAFDLGFKSSKEKTSLLMTLELGTVTLRRNFVQGMSLTSSSARTHFPFQEICLSIDASVIQQRFFSLRREIKSLAKYHSSKITSEKESFFSKASSTNSIANSILLLNSRPPGKGSSSVTYGRRLIGYCFLVSQ